jgi:hypothetical protein
MKPDVPATLQESWADFERMVLSKEGLRLMLASMPPGSTLEDAARLHRKLAQLSRRPCSFLDEELGIERGR